MSQFSLYVIALKQLYLFLLLIISSVSVKCAQNSSFLRQGGVSTSNFWELGEQQLFSSVSSVNLHIARISPFFMNDRQSVKRSAFKSVIMSSILFSLPELYTTYKNWVSSHPQLASDFETTTKWVSYFIAGRINNSSIVSELIYSLSNLLVLFNDRIISKSRELDLPGSGDKLKLWLTVLDYSEVFFELSAKKLWGETGKWAIIVILQIFKCISRLLLVFHHKESIVENPPIPVLKRKLMNQNSYISDYTVVDEARAQLESMSFVLKRSGKVIRKVEAAPPINIRNWKPINSQQNDNKDQSIEQSLAGRQLIAETIYILKPIAHLGSVFCFGNNTWKPWMLSLLFDATSLHLYNSCQKSKLNCLSKKQRLQLSRRTLALVLYLLRSPFYEKHSQDRIQAFLNSLGNKIPLASLICSPLAQYIPHWQKTYFYMWST